MVPGETLERDLSTGSLPTFGWLTPDLCNDAHDCPLRVTDRYLSKLIPRLAPHLGPDGCPASVAFARTITTKGSHS